MKVDAASRIKSALYYLDKFNFSVIPVGPDKKPLIKWEEFQTRRASKKEILEWFIKWPDANIGIVTGKLSGIAVVDVDDVTKEGVLSDYIHKDQLIPKCTTPRGGYHLYFAYPKGEDVRGANGIFPKIDVKSDKGYVVAPPSTNGNGKGYVWDADLHLTKIDMPEFPENLALKLKSLDSMPVLGTESALSFNITNNNNASETCYNYGGQTQTVTSITKHNIELLDGSRDESLFHVANLLIKGGGKYEEAWKVLEILGKNCVPPFPEKELHLKIKSALDRAARKDIKIADVVYEWCLSHGSNFSITDISRLSQVVTKDMPAVRMAVSRLCQGEKPLLRKMGKGRYEVIEEEEDIVLDVCSPDKEALNLKLPLGVHKYVKLLPKNIVMLAGEVNAGKTAYLLNLAGLNMEKWETTYFSSEMGEEELKMRLKMFEFPLETWKKVMFLDKSSDFHNKINPNGLNIIDFMEIYEEFYNISKYIRLIYDKLDKGIAVIAIQKNKGRDEGMGGERSKEKARLYMAMEPGKLKIIKAKNWAVPGVNPNGMEASFKLVNGCRFIGGL